MPHLTLTNAFRSWEHLPPKGRHGMVRSEHKGNMPVRLGCAIIYVPDVTAAVEFYERAFGLARRFVHDSGEYAEMETGATALGFANEGFTRRRTIRSARTGQARRRPVSRSPSSSRMCLRPSSGRSRRAPSAGPSPR